MKYKAKRQSLQFLFHFLKNCVVKTVNKALTIRIGAFVAICLSLDTVIHKRVHSRQVF